MADAKNLVAAADVAAFRAAAVDEIRAVERVAQQYALTDEDADAIRRAVQKVEGYTLAMAAGSPACAPWWAWVLVAAAAVGLGAGVAWSSCD